MNFKANPISWRNLVRIFPQPGSRERETGALNFASIFYPISSPFDPAVSFVARKIKCEVDSKED